MEREFLYNIMTAEMVSWGMAQANIISSSFPL